jgi:hypothetical protein
MQKLNIKPWNAILFVNNKETQARPAYSVRRSWAETTFSGHRTFIYKTIV